MPVPLVSSFHDLVLSFASIFTQPSFQNFLTILAGSVFCTGRHTVTGPIVAAGAVGKKHFSCYHRFFSRAVWNLDSLGHLILKLALRFVPEGETVLFAADDTLGRKTGRHIWGAGMHHDPLRSTATRHFFAFGHSWVVLSIIVPLPFVSHRRFAIPFLFRLYRKKAKERKPGRPKGERKSTGEATATEHRTRPELAVEMLEIAAGWLDGRRFRVVGDSEYSGKSVSRRLPANADLVGRMPMDAALYAEPADRKPGRLGCPRKKGERLPNPAELARASVDEDARRHLRQVRKGMVQDMHRALVQLGRDTSSSRRRGPRPVGEEARRLLLHDGPLDEADRDHPDDRASLVAGGGVPRREAVARVRGAAVADQEGGGAHRAHGVRALLPDHALVRRARGSAQGEVVCEAAVVSEEEVGELRRHAGDAETGQLAEANFIDPARRPGSREKAGNRIVQLQTWLLAAG